MTTPQRLVSLLPSSTEILCALGLEASLVGVSHACDYPISVHHLPRLTLPLSLSYDHRVIDGVAGARFTTFLATVLADIRKVLL